MAQQVKNALSKVMDHHALAVVKALDLHKGGRVACHMKAALEAETACIAEAGQRFTPFLQPPLIDILDELRPDKKAFDAVLIGTCETPWSATIT